MKLPPQPVSALVYTAAAHSANLWTPESAQGRCLNSWALPWRPARRSACQPEPGKRHDIIQLGGENLAAGLNGNSLFLFAGDQKDADAIYANPLLAHLPAVRTSASIRWVQKHSVSITTAPCWYCSVSPRSSANLHARQALRLPARV
jgi:ABC-type Fe2+-enterobactin transport system substrate-binding protein